MIFKGWTISIIRQKISKFYHQTLQSTDSIFSLELLDMFWKTVIISFIVLIFSFLSLKCLMKPAETLESDPLFSLFPLEKKSVLLPESGFSVPVPFLSYDMRAFIIHGWMEPELIGELMKNEDFTPILTSDRKALVAVWLIHHNSSLGAYKEIICSVNSVERKKGELKLPCASTDVFCSPYAILGCYNSVGYIHKLYLDNDIAVAYGRELLSLDKHKGVFNSEIYEDEVSKYKVSDKEGNPVVDITISPQNSVWEQLVFCFDMVKTFGIKNIANMLLSDVLYVMAAGKKGIAGFTKDQNNRLLYAQSTRGDVRFHRWRENDVIRNMRFFGDESKKGEQFHPVVVQSAFGGRFAMFSTTQGTNKLVS